MPPSPQLCGGTPPLHICSLSTWQCCNIKTSPNTMCAPVTPLEEGIFGVGHIAGLEPNTSALPVSRKRVVQELFSLSKSSNMASRSKSFCGPDDCCHLLISLVLCSSFYALMYQTLASNIASLRCIKGKRKTAKNVNLK